MSLLHDNVPAENGVSSQISLKVHGLLPSGSHLPVGEWSRQAHTQEECKVAQPVAEQAKTAHEELKGCTLSPAFCSSRDRVCVQGGVEHTYFTLFSPLVCNTISSDSALFPTNATHLLFFWLPH